MRTYERGVEIKLYPVVQGFTNILEVAVLKVINFFSKVKCKSGDILVVDNNNGYAILTGSAIQMDRGVWTMEIGWI